MPRKGGKAHQREDLLFSHGAWALLQKGALSFPESPPCPENSSCLTIRYQAWETELHEEETQAFPSRWFF